MKHSNPLKQAYPTEDSYLAVCRANTAKWEVLRAALTDLEAGDTDKAIKCIRRALGLKVEPDHFVD